MIAATSADTSESLSRRSLTSASNSAAKPGSEASSRRIAAVRGILAYRLTEAFNQRRHLGRAQLEIGRATSELQSIMRISYAVFSLKNNIEPRSKPCGLTLHHYICRTLQHRSYQKHLQYETGNRYWPN